MSTQDSIREQARDNKDFRRVAATGPYSQIVLMCLKPGEAIGEEVHGDTDQIFLVAKGEGEAVLADAPRRLDRAQRRRPQGLGCWPPRPGGWRGATCCWGRRAPDTTSATPATSACGW